MVYLTSGDYLKLSKKNKIVNHTRGSHGGIAISPKTRLPTQYRTLKHNCAHCPRTDAKKYSISEKEVRWLCPVCVIRNTNSNSKEKPHFIKASMLRIRNV